MSVVSSSLKSTILRHLRTHLLFYLVVVLIGLYRVALVPVGQDYLMDEGRYHRSSEVMLGDLYSGDLREALRLTFMQQGRPLAGIIGLIPAQIQNWLSLTSSLVSLWNVAVSLMTIAILYRILCLYTPNRVQAAGGVALFALIHSTSLFIRHLLSYDWALAILMAVLYYVLSRQQDKSLSRKAAVLCGVVAGLGFSTYPGYFPLVGIIALLIALFYKPRYLALLRFLLGLCAVMIVLEVVSRLVGAWNIRSVVGVSGTVIQGDFSEGYSFGISYILASENWYGLVLLLLFGLSMVLVFFRRNVAPRCRAAIALGLLAYLAYGTLGVVFQYAVEYGRLIHMYMPILVMGAVLTLISLGRYQGIAWGGLIGLGIIAFIGNASVYLPMQYPKDMTAYLSANYPNAKVCGIVTDDHWESQDLTGCDLIAVNLVYFREDRTSWIPTKPFEPPANWQPIRLTLHPVNYPPYMFTGYNIAQRAAIIKFPEVMGIYKVSGNRAAQ